MTILMKQLFPRKKSENGNRATAYTVPAYWQPPADISPSPCHCVEGESFSCKRNLKRLLFKSEGKEDIMGKEISEKKYKDKLERKFLLKDEAKQFGGSKSKAKLLIEKRQKLIKERLKRETAEYANHEARKNAMVELLRDGSRNMVVSRGSGSTSDSVRDGSEKSGFDHINVDRKNPLAPGVELIDEEQQKMRLKLDPPQPMTENPLMRENEVSLESKEVQHAMFDRINLLKKCDGEHRMGCAIGTKAAVCALKALDDDSLSIDVVSSNPGPPLLHPDRLQTIRWVMDKLPLPGKFGSMLNENKLFYRDNSNPEADDQDSPNPEQQIAAPVFGPGNLFDDKSLATALLKNRLRVESSASGESLAEQSDGLKANLLLDPDVDENASKDLSPEDAVKMKTEEKLLLAGRLTDRIRVSKKGCEIAFVDSSNRKKPSVPALRLPEDFCKPWKDMVCQNMPSGLNGMREFLDTSVKARLMSTGEDWNSPLITGVKTQADTDAEIVDDANLADAEHAPETAAGSTGSEAGGTAEGKKSPDSVPDVHVKVQ